jgi:hypothetical protein
MKNVHQEWAVYIQNLNKQEIREITLRPFSAVSGNINLKKPTHVHPVVYQLEIKTRIRYKKKQ